MTPKEPTKSTEDELTDFEKIIQSIGQMATIMRAYYEALREGGFSHKDAMFLTSQYQKDVLYSFGKRNTKDES